MIDNITRRKMLAGSASLGATLLPKSAVAKKGVGEKMRLPRERVPTREEKIAAVTGALKHYRALGHVLMQPTPDRQDPQKVIQIDAQIQSLLDGTFVGSMWRVLDKQYGLRGTPFDMAPQFAKRGYPSVTLAEDATKINGYRLISPSATNLFRALDEIEGGMGTAFRLQTVNGSSELIDTMVTNAHVMDGIRGKPPSVHGLDVATFAPQLSTRHLPLPLTLQAEEINMRVSGCLVAVVGSKPDITAMQVAERDAGVVPGAKVRGGLALPYTPLLHDFVMRHSPIFNDTLVPGFREYFMAKYYPGKTYEEMEREMLDNRDNSFVFVDSPIEGGEVHVVHKDKRGRDVVGAPETLAKGTSGSPVLRFNFDAKPGEDKWVLTGINHSGMPILLPTEKPDEYRMMYLGVFHGPDALRRGVMKK
jgi:hypothetical protein